MSTDIRANIDHVDRLSPSTPYLVNYRLSSKADPTSDKGDRKARYAALRRTLELLAGSELNLFEDEGHISTSSWIIYASESAKVVGQKLQELLAPGYDFLAVFEIKTEYRWSLPDKDGDRAQSIKL